MKPHIIYLLVTVALISGCAAPGVRQAEEVKQFCAQRFADSSIDPVRSKIVIPIVSTEAQPIEMLANRERPNADEREAILALANARIACNKFSYERLGPPPAYRSATQDRITAILADLYAGEMTYGEFNKALLFIGERDRLAAEELDDAIRERERWRDVYYSN
jgi:hypothetical protein